MAKQLNVNMNFTADVSNVENNLNKLKQSLNQISSAPIKVGNIDKDLKEAATSARQLQIHLNNAFNQKTGNLDLSKLQTSLAKSGQSLSQLSVGLLGAGKDGQQAFLQMQQAIQNANIQIRKSTGFLSEMGTVLKNTVRWQLSSSMLHGFMGAVQNAKRYAEDLNKSLTNIRIVTGQSSDEMAEFAERANKAAKSLNSTTTAYTNAALIYYQQGLGDQEVQERTDTTIKLSNVTGQSAEEVSSYMTAIWNNFDDGSESLEHYADVITALGASTASSSREIAEGLEKFASVGETVGLSYDYATAALATVVAQTRQSADVVGTSFKTLFSRLQGLKLGETLDDGTDLNKYSQGLAAVGVDIKTASGELKDMDVILDELGARWKTLSKDQQVALAQTVGGVRQYNQMISLMDNYDIFKQNLDIAKDSSGALQEQADIYGESWEAASKNVKASLQGVYQSIIDDKAIIKFTQSIADVVNGIDNIIEATGGMKTVLLGTGLIAAKIFKNDIANGIDAAVIKFNNFKIALGQTKNLKDLGKIGQKTKEVSYENLIKESQESLAKAYSKFENKKGYEGFVSKIKGLQEENRLSKMLAENQDKMSESIKKEVDARLGIISGINDELSKEEEKLALLKQQNEELQEAQDRNYLTNVQKVDDNFYATKSVNIKNLADGSEDKSFREQLASRFNQSKGIEFDWVGGKKGSSAYLLAESEKEINLASQQVEKNYISVSKLLSDINNKELSWVDAIEKNNNILSNEEKTYTQVIEIYTNLQEIAKNESLTEEEKTQQINEQITALEQELIYYEKMDEFTQGGNIRERVKVQMEVEGQENYIRDTKKDLDDYVKETKNIIKESSINLKSLGEGLTGIINGASQAAMGISMLTGAFKTFNAEGATIGDKIAAISSGLMALPMIIGGINTAIKGIEGALGALNVELTVSTGGLWAIVLAIGAVIGGIVAWVKHQDKIKDSTDDLIEKNKELKESISELSSELDTLKSKLDQLKEQKDLKIANGEDTKELDKQINLLEARIKLQERELANEKLLAQENAKKQIESTKTTGAEGKDYTFRGKTYSAQDYVEATIKGGIGESDAKQTLENLKDIQTTFDDIVSNDNLLGTPEYETALTWLEKIQDAIEQVKKTEAETTVFSDEGFDKLKGTKFYSKADFFAKDTPIGFGKYEYNPQTFAKEWVEGTSYEELQTKIIEAARKAIEAGNDYTKEDLKKTLGEYSGLFEDELLKSGKKLEDYRTAVIKSITAGEDFEQSLEDAVEAADDAGDSVNSLSESIKKLNDVSKGIKDLQTAFGEFKEDGKVTYDTLSSISSNFNDVEGIENYIKTLADGDTTAKEFNQTLSDLVYAKIQQSMTDEEIIASGQDVIQSMLESYGVTNAAAVAQSIYQQALYNTKAAVTATATEEQKKAAADIDVANSSKWAAGYLEQQAASCGMTKNAFIALVAEENIFNNSKLDVSQKISALNELAKQAGYTGTLIDFANATNSEAAKRRLGNMSADELNAYLQRRLNSVLNIQAPEINQATFSVPNTSSSKSSSGGGGSKKKAGDAYKKMDKKEKDPSNRYKDITKKINENSDALDRLSKARDKAYGANHLKAMDAEINKLKENIGLQKKLYNQAIKNKNSDKKALNKTAKKISKVKVKYNDDGTIANEEALLEAARKNENKKIKVYNNYREKNKDKDLNKKENKDIEKKLKQLQKDAEKAAEATEKLEQNMANYEQSVEEARQAQQAMYDSIIQMREIKLEKIKYKAELKFEINERNRKDLQKKLDNLFSLNGSFVNRGIGATIKDLQKNYQNDNKVAMNSARSVLTKMGISDKHADQILSGSKANEKQMQKLANSGMLSPDDVDAIKEYGDKIRESAEAMGKTFDQFLEGFGREIDLMNEKFDKAFSTNERLRGNAETIRDIRGLLGQGIGGYDEYADNTAYLKFAKKSYIADTINAQAEEMANKEISTNLKNAASNYRKKALDKNTKDTTMATNAYNTLSELAKQTKEAAKEAHSKELESFKSALDIIQEQYDLDVSHAGEKFEKSISKGFDSVDKALKAYELDKEIKDLSLEGYDEEYNLNKLNRDITKTLKDTSGTQDRRKLINLQDKISKYLKDGNKLSKAQLEVLKSQYAIEKARIDYENAQNNKNQVQMQRDANGNWSYVYTSSTEDKEDARQKLEDELIAAAKANNQNIEDLTKKYYDSFAQEQAELSAAKTEEERNAINSRYEEYRRGLQSSWEEYMKGNKEILAQNRDIITNTEGVITELSQISPIIYSGINNGEKAIKQYMQALLTAENKRSQEQWETLKAVGYAVYDAATGWKLTKEGEKALAQTQKATQVTDEQARKYISNIDNLLHEGGDLYDSITNFQDEALVYYDQITKFLQYFKDHKSNTGTSVNGKLEKGEWVSLNAEKDMKGNKIDQSINYKYIGKTKNGDYKFTDYEGNVVYIDKDKLKEDVNTETFATGGYTGDWNTKDGKLAMLHEKELVLNQNDTRNLLDGIKILRDIQLPRLFNFRLDAFDRLKYQKEVNSLNQNVTIHAEFPNATNHSEIEEAFGNLINSAVQYANRKDY